MPMTRSNAPGGHAFGALALAATLGVATLGAAGGPARARSVKLTKTADVSTRLFKLKRVSVDHPLGELRIRGWDKRLVRIQAVKQGPDAGTVRRLKVHVDVNKSGPGRMEIRTGVLMKVPQPKNARRTQRLMLKAQKIRTARLQLMKQPKPWTAQTREQIRKLGRELLATVRALQEDVSSKLVAKLRSVPIKGASLELTLFVPRGIILVGKTTQGDIDVAELRGPVTLTSRRGRIFARDVRGAVSTRTDEGHQYLSSIRGAVSVNATTGDLRLRSVRGPRILATLINGHIIGHGLNAPLVRFTTTQGNVTVTATLRANGRLEVRTRRGDIDVRFLPRVGFRMLVQTRHGRLDLPRGAVTRGSSPLHQRGRYGRYGRGTGVVDLRTVYGNVKLR
jgi:hypothetical protein